jgi:signal transduction histidine kinase
MHLKTEAQEKENWKKLLSALPEPVLLVKQSMIVYYNQATLNVLDINGAPEDHIKLIEQQLENVESHARPITLASIIKNQTLVTPLNEMYRLHRPQGPRTLEVKSVRIIQEEGSVYEYILSDLSPMEELQMARAAQACLKILVGTASHSVRTPLNIMEGALELALETTTSSTVAEHLRLAKVSAQQMKWYLLALSYLQQLDGHSLQIDAQSFDPRAAVAEVVAMYESSAQIKKIPLMITYGPNLPKTFCTDKKKYQLIVSFLIRNALKYTFHGSIAVSLQGDVPSRSMITEVRDTGIGIAPKVAQRLFRLIPDMETSDHLNPQGIGLGLHVSKALSKELQGDLVITSAEGQGTQASLSLPEYPATRTYSTFSTPSPDNHSTSLNLPFSQFKLAPLPPKHCDCKKILIVDDEPLNVKVLTAFLAKANFAADATSNGQEALDAVLAKSKSECCKGYKVILMDINMPMMDGVEATRRIKQLIKQHQIPRTNILAVTAAAQLENAEVSARYAEIGFKRIRKSPPSTYSL